jgi:hypothetical protein
MRKGSQKDGKNDAKIALGAIFKASKNGSKFGGVGVQARSNWRPPPPSIFLKSGPSREDQEG